jgi:hypothetical protein
MKPFIAVMFLVLSATTSLAQNFRADLRKLNGQIDAAYKSRKLTETEYGKLKREQEVIKQAIDKALADDIMTPDEKNKIHSKIVRSRKRLVKYKTNREIY